MNQSPIAADSHGFIPFDNDLDAEYAEVFRTKYVHLRYRFEHDEDQNNPHGISNRGGVTIGYRHVGDEVEWTFALCSLGDNFNRKRGRMIVDGRFEAEAYMVSLWPGTCAEFLDIVVKPKVFAKIRKYNNENDYVLEDCLR